MFRLVAKGYLQRVLCSSPPVARSKSCSDSTSLRQGPMQVLQLCVYSLWLYGSAGLSELVVLDIGNNAFFGMLPEHALQSMTSLNVCKFGNNQLAGSLPEIGVMGLA
eukprot:5582193-Amphidinium_carterae.1